MDVRVLYLREFPVITKMHHVQGPQAALERRYFSVTRVTLIIYRP